MDALGSVSRCCYQSHSSYKNVRHLLSTFNPVVEYAKTIPIFLSTIISTLMTMGPDCSNKVPSSTSS